MSPWKVILATMVIFVCGIVTGVLVTRTQVIPAPIAAATPAGIPGPGPVNSFIRRLGPLKLTLDQSNSIVKILRDGQATNAAIRKTIAPLLAKEMDLANEAIKKVLDADQRPLFAALQKEHEKEIGERGRGGRGGDGAGFGRRNSTNRIGSNGVQMDDRGRGSRGGGPTNTGEAADSVTN